MASVSNGADNVRNGGCGNGGSFHNKSMKTYIVPVVVSAFAVGMAMAGFADPGVSAAYQPANSYQSVADQKDADAAPDAAANAAPAATAATKDADAAPDAAAKEEAAATACTEAKTAAANSGGGDAAAQQNVQQKCVAVDYAAENPVDTPGANIPTQNSSLGADARDQAAYNPPANPKVNGVTLSWAKIESFKQIMKQPDANGNVLSDNAIAGIGGRLQLESHAFQLNQWDSNGNLLTKYGDASEGDYNKDTKQYTSFGVAQYHNTKDTNGDGLVDAGRGTNMMNAVGGTSLSPNGLQGTTNAQYGYLKGELQQQVGTKTYDSYLEGTDTSVDQAAQSYTAKYEVPAKDGSQAFGLAGGNDTVANADGISKVMGSDSNPVINNSVSSWESTHVTGKNTNTGGSYVVPAGGSGSAGNGASGSGGSSGSAANTAGGLFGGSTGSAAGLQGGLFGTGTGTTGTNSLANAAIGQLIANALSGKTGTTASTGTASTPATSSGSSSSSTAHGYDVLLEVARKCGKDLPSSSDAIMLMIKECQTTN